MEAAVRRMVLRKKAGLGSAAQASRLAALPGVEPRAFALPATSGEYSPFREEAEGAGQPAAARPPASARAAFEAGVRLLWQPSDHLQLQLADMVLFEAGKPRTWLFTSGRTGGVMRKTQSKLTLREIARAMGKRAQQLALAAGARAATREQFICVARSVVSGRADLRVEMLRVHELLELLEDAHRMARLVALQSCATVEGCSAVYSTRFRAAPTPGFETMRLSDDTNLLGAQAGAQYDEELRALLPPESRDRRVYVKSREVRIRSRAHRVNEELEELTTRVVRFVERARGRKVLELRAEFVCTSGQPPTLTHVSDLRLRAPQGSRPAGGAQGSSGSESPGSHFSSGSSEDPAGQEQRQRRPQDEPQDAQGGIARFAVSAKARPVPAHARQVLLRALRQVRAAGETGPACCGQFCEAREIRDEDALEEIEAQVRLENGERPEATHAVVLLHVVQAALLRATASFRHDRGSMPTWVINVPKVPDHGLGASDLAEIFQLLPSRLYEPVAVCATCSEVYQAVERHSLIRTRPQRQQLQQQQQQQQPVQNQKLRKKQHEQPASFGKAPTPLARCFFCKGGSRHGDLCALGSCPACDRQLHALGGQQQAQQQKQQVQQQKQQVQQVQQGARPSGKPAPPKHAPMLRVDPQHPVPLAAMVHNLSELWLREDGVSHAEADRPASAARSSKAPPPPPQCPPPWLASSRTSTEGKGGSEGKTEEAKPRHVAALHNKLRPDLLNTNGARVIHPPLLAIHRKAFIPAQTVKDA